MALLPIPALPRSVSQSMKATTCGLRPAARAAGGIAAAAEGEGEGRGWAARGKSHRLTGDRRIKRSRNRARGGKKGDKELRRREGHSIVQESCSVRAVSHILRK